MEKTCLDVDVLIELSKRKLIPFIDAQDNLYIPSIVLYEYLKGIRLLGRDLDKVISEIKKRFHIIWTSYDVLKTAASLYTELKERGITVYEPILLTAAHCITENIPIATFDRRPYKYIPHVRFVEPERIISYIISKIGQTTT